MTPPPHPPPQLEQVCVLYWDVLLNQNWDYPQKNMVDDENVKTTVYACRDRFVFFVEPIYKAQTETSEIKGHYLC
jgi:hypothetical protein